MSWLTINKAAGLALMVGVVLWFVTAVFNPGAVTEDSEGQTAFFLRRLAAWAENASLTHLMTMLTTLSMTLHGFGLYYLTRLPKQSSVGDLALRFGVLATLAGWLILIIAMGIRHMIVHILGLGTEPELTVEGLDLELTLYAAHVGVIYAAFAIGGLAHIFLGLALAARLRSVLYLRIIGYAIAVTGAAGILNLILINHLADADFGILATVSTVVASGGSVWLLAVGYGMFRGHGELAPDAGAG